MTRDTDNAAEMPERALDEEAEAEALPLGDLFGRLIASAKALAAAERDFAAARLGILAGALWKIVLFALLGLIIAFGLIIALMVSAVLWLAPMVGTGVAMLIVTGVTSLFLLFCALAVRGEVRKILAIPR